MPETHQRDVDERIFAQLLAAPDLAHDGRGMTPRIARQRSERTTSDHMIEIMTHGIRNPVRMACSYLLQHSVQTSGIGSPTGSVPPLEIVVNNLWL